jgi:transposase
MTPANGRRRRTREQVLTDESKAHRHRLASELEAEARRLIEKAKALHEAAEKLSTRQ